MTSESLRFPCDISALQVGLLLWFEDHQRSFPWRKTRDPYAILIAEKLLQQTAARRSVIEAYLKFMENYSSPELLAQADVNDLESLIGPLGFHYRALELRTLGRTVVEQYGGCIPADLQELLRLPGVGDYSARAVLSFAFQQDIPVVDTNVARLLYRLFGIQGALPSNPARKRSLLQYAAKLIPPGRSRDFNLAILDLCASICTVRNPQCGICPIQPYCAYGQTDLASR